MATGVEELLDMLYEMIDEAKSMPLSGDKCVLERDKALDLLDEIRAQFPVELGEAKKLLSARAEYIASARREADGIRKQADDQARQLVADHEILSQAKQMGNDMVKTAEERSRTMVKTAEERSRELCKVANEYCEDLLRRTEEAVAEAYDELKRSHANFRAAAAAMSAPAAPAQPARVIYDAEADE